MSTALFPVTFCRALVCDRRASSQDVSKMGEVENTTSSWWA